MGLSGASPVIYPICMYWIHIDCRINTNSTNTRYWRQLSCSNRNELRSGDVWLHLHRIQFILRYFSPKKSRWFWYYICCFYHLDRSRNTTFNWWFPRAFTYVGTRNRRSVIFFTFIWQNEFEKFISWPANCCCWHWIQNSCTQAFKEPHWTSHRVYLKKKN